MNWFARTFRAVAARQPDADSVQMLGERTWSYAELDERASRVARRLGATGARRGDVLALDVPRSPQLLAAWLGCWIAGVAIFPVPRDVPRPRRTRMLRGARARYCLSGRELELRDVGQADLSHSRWPGLSHVFCTSGSTGAPKAIAVPHAGVEALVRAQVAAFALTRRSRVFWYLAPHFDASISDVCTALAAGATLVLHPEARRLTCPGLLEFLSTHAITHVDLPPSVLARLPSEACPPALQTVVVGGEVCPRETWTAWSGRVRLVNCYGPTEATVCTSLRIAADGDSRNRDIGRPLPGLRYRIVDAAGCPTDEGELWIGGPAVAYGYLGEPHLTEERFVFREDGRWFRTGDRVRRDANGRYQFLGRLDRQTKIRGLLVAPEEIEFALTDAPNVRRAAVVKREVRGRDGLVAFVVPVSAPIDEVRLRESLARRLPPWMLPTRIEPLERLPALDSQKVDFATLRQMDLATAPRATHPVETHDEVEAMLAAIWREVLSCEDVAPEDDFFALGGDSFAVLEMVALSEERGLPVTVGDVARHRTLRRIAAASTAADARDAAALRGLGSPAAAPSHVSSDQNQRPPPGRGAVLMTGVTGFLGRQLLTEVLARTDREVVCIVRATSDAHAAARLPPHDRVAVLAGDVARPRFDLGADAWRRVCDDVTDIFHCAARVHLTAPFESLRDVNVGGTREILRLQRTARPKRLHYASTLSVFVSSEPTLECVSEDEDLSSIEKVYGGYAQSKYVAEALVRASTASNCPTNVFRLGLLTGHATTRSRRPGDWLRLVFRGIAELGAIPSGSSRLLRCDVTPVAYAAAAMAHIALNQTSGGERALETFHVANDGGASLEDLAIALRAHGVTVDDLRDEAWRARLRTALRGEPSRELCVLALAMSRLGDEGRFRRHRPLGLFQKTGVEFSCAATRRALRGSGISCPPPSAALLASYAGEAVAGGGSADCGEPTSRR